MARKTSKSQILFARNESVNSVGDGKREFRERKNRGEKIVTNGIQF